MFTPGDRKRLKDGLIARARADDRVVAAALLGSSAGGREDEWSDVDLALSIPEQRLDATVNTWTAVMYDEHGAVHHLDVRWRTTLYRVFLLASTLQVDLSFWSTIEFVAVGPRFELLFGDPPATHDPGSFSAQATIGEAWLHLLHARSALARGRRWQADYMIAGARDRVLALACERLGTQPDHARGVDELPSALLQCYTAMIPTGLGDDELRSALKAVAVALSDETRQVDEQLAGRIAATLDAIAPR